MTAPALVWFRDDLRLADHPALHEAASTDMPLIAVHVLDETCGRSLGGAARWYLAGALEGLRDALGKQGVTLLSLTGDAGTLIPDLARQWGVQAVYWNDRIEAAHIRQDDAIERALKAHDIDVHRHFAMLLRRPGVVTTQNGTPYRVFTAYWRAVQSAGDPPDPLPAPKHLRGASSPECPEKLKLAPASLRPQRPNWAAGFAKVWKPDEATAQARLAEFVEDDLADYEASRNTMAEDGTSRLSPDLRFGLLSPRQIWQAASGRKQAQGYLSEIGWREFAHDTLARAPDLSRNNLRAQFDKMPWRQSSEDLRAWQRGQTGIPIVDAGMRQLWQTGWTHNRARMIVGSFLVKHLLIDWRMGEQWFWDTLVDADPANNPVNWQWVAGSGIDASPYFRVFNPVLQAEKFDRSGDYVRRWVPELARLPDRALQEPWAQPDAILRQGGVALGKTYPQPIVDLKGGRARALEAFKAIG